MDTLSAKLLAIVNAAEAGLGEISEQEGRAPLLAGGWSRKQVLGHLIDSACNNHQRFVRAVLEGTLDFPGYNQNAWESLQAPQDVPWHILVALWTNDNRYLAHVIGRIPAAKLDAVCRIGSGDPVTLRFLVEDYLQHLIHHLEQIGCCAAGART